jgi:hypothetical protein
VEFHLRAGCALKFFSIRQKKEARFLTPASRINLLKVLVAGFDANVNSIASKASGIPIRIDNIGIKPVIVVTLIQPTGTD